MYTIDAPSHLTQDFRCPLPSWRSLLPFRRNAGTSLWTERSHNERIWALTPHPVLFRRCRSSTGLRRQQPGERERLPADAKKDQKVLHIHVFTACPLASQTRSWVAFPTSSCHLSLCGKFCLAATQVSIIDKGMKKTRYIYTVKYCLAVKKNEILPFATAWMVLWEDLRRSYTK